MTHGKTLTLAISSSPLASSNSGALASYIPLDRIGLDDTVKLVPMDLAALGIGATAQSIAEKVKADLERGVKPRIYGWPRDEDFRAAPSDDVLDDLCAAFEALYANEADFRDKMSRREASEMMRSYVTDMFGAIDNAPPQALTRRFNSPSPPKCEVVATATFPGRRSGPDQCK